MYKKFSITLFILFIGALPLVSSAAVDTPEKVIGVIEKLSGWLYSALVAVAVVFIILGAFGFFMAGGDESKISKAKQQILYAVIAVVTALLATGIIEITKELLGA